MPAIAPPDPPLSDGTVTLRGFEPSDVGAIVEICQDPEIPRWTPVPSPYREAEARAYLQRVADGWATGTHASFAIVDAGDGRMLGTAALMALDAAPSAAEIGYVLAAPARGRGAVTRTVQLLAGWAFGTLGLERLELHIDRDNAASCAVAARTGFVRVAEPVIRRPETAHYTNDVYFARLAPGA
jgi:RimJ/RimL family protein N-acetyltransferase